MIRLTFPKIMFKKTELKPSTLTFILNSYSESTKLERFQHFINNFLMFEHFFFGSFYLIKKKRELASCILRDMLGMVCMWRQIRGYPTGGNTTHTNAKTCRKNKLLFNFRVNQYYNWFGKKKRDIYPTLVKAEYTNRLWYLTWTAEYAQASTFAMSMADKGLKIGCFNPVLLAQNHVNGFTRTGKAANLSKAKRLTKTYTIGVPLLFARYIFPQKTPIGFPRILLKDDVNKNLGKRLKRKNR